MNSDKYKFLTIVVAFIFILALGCIVGYFDTKQKQIELEKMKVEQVIRK